VVDVKGCDRGSRRCTFQGGTDESKAVLQEVVV
jgi:hypothetical protein